MMSSNTLNPRICALPVEMTHAILDFLPLSCVLELSIQSSRASSRLLSSPTWRPLFTSSTRLELFQKLYYLILDIHTLYCPTPFVHGEWKTSPELTLTYRWYAVRKWMRRMDPVIDLFTQMEECVVGALRALAFTSRLRALDSPSARKGKKEQSQLSKSRAKWPSWNRGSDDSVKSGFEVERFRVFLDSFKIAQRRKNLLESTNLCKLAALLEKCMEEVGVMAGAHEECKEEISVMVAAEETPRKSLQPLIAFVQRQIKDCLHRPILRPSTVPGDPFYLETSLPYDTLVVLLVQTPLTLSPLLGSDPTARPPVPADANSSSRDFARLYFDRDGCASGREQCPYSEYPATFFYTFINGLGINAPISGLREADKRVSTRSVPWDPKNIGEMGEELDDDEEVETEEEKEQREATKWMAAFLKCAAYFENRFPGIRREVEERYVSVDCDVDEEL
ncbi:hypothetical protein BU16DRAFT_580782 [Lophium mytilinum]|uniref:F-box domain-containing protein n=1 Tax=Lophium mytilinum TaxID=390894 RepID=A0A6A6QWW7_9PEZI|nr:hypothetical protein BU16DRAFT_580782 [Lophium mytilinum]